MNYELAKELMDVGFTQVPIFSKDSPHGHYMEGAIESDETGIITTNSVYIPTLEELIEACGKEFYSVVRARQEDWRAFSEKDQWNTIATADGKTPTEAVARLWLALNKEDEKEV